MKKRVKLIITTLIILVLITIAIFLCFNYNKGKEDIFRLSIENPQKVIKVNEEVTFTARLTNLTDKEYTLYHGEPLISLYIRSKDDDTPEITYSILVKSVIEPSGYIEKKLNIKALEAGEYILRAKSSFEVEGVRYELNCEDVPILIVDK